LIKKLHAFAAATTTTKTAATVTASSTLLQLPAEKKTKKITHNL